MKSIVKMEYLKTYELTGEHGHKCLVWKSKCRHYYIKLPNVPVIRIRVVDMLSSLAYLEYNVEAII